MRFPFQPVTPAVHCRRPRELPGVIRAHYRDRAAPGLKSHVKGRSSQAPPSCALWQPPLCCAYWGSRSAGEANGPLRGLDHVASRRLRKGFDDARQWSAEKRGSKETAGEERWARRMNLCCAVKSKEDEAISRETEEQRGFSLRGKRWERYWRRRKGTAL